MISMSIGFFKDLIPVLKGKGIEVMALSSPGKEMDELKEKGVPTITIPIERHISVKKDIRL